MTNRKNIDNIIIKSNDMRYFLYSLEGGKSMNTTEKIYLDADEIVELLGVSKGFAYKIIRELNKELRSRNYIVIAGRVPKKFFQEKYYGFDN